MADGTISAKRQEAFVNEVSGLAGELAGKLSEWAKSEPRTLLDMEQATLQVLHELGDRLLSGLCQLAVPAYPVQQVRCSCGQMATYERMRQAHVPTLLGQIAIARPYYLCPARHHGVAPLDRVLGFAAGSLSPGLAELLALLGAQFTFEEAATLTAKLTLISVCPNSVAQETEALSQAIVAAEAVEVTQAWSASPVAAGTSGSAQPPLRFHGWRDCSYPASRLEKEIKLGAVNTTKTIAPRNGLTNWQSERRTSPYYTDLADFETFGSGLWLEAHRRGVTQAQEVVAIGDGAAWIWKLVEEHWPQGVHIVIGITPPSTFGALPTRFAAKART